MSRIAQKPFIPPEVICWQALNGELGLIEAAEALIYGDYTGEECFEDVFPEAEVLSEMLDEASRSDAQTAIESTFREKALAAFEKLLDQFTTPHTPYVEPPHFPLPRSTPQEWQTKYPYPSQSTDQKSHEE